MKSHHTGKEKEAAGGLEMDYTDTLWFPTAIKHIKENTCTHGPINRSRETLGCYMILSSQEKYCILAVNFQGKSTQWKN